MTLGLGVLGHSPSTFWRMTPVELFCAARAWQDPESPPAPMTRQEFESLRHHYTD